MHLVVLLSECVFSGGHKNWHVTFVIWVRRMSRSGVLDLHPSNKYNGINRKYEIADSQTPGLSLHATHIGVSVGICCLHSQLLNTVVDVKTRGYKGIRKGYAERERDVKVYNVTLSYKGIELLKESTLTLMHGQIYGMLGMTQNVKGGPLFEGDHI